MFSGWGGVGKSGRGDGSANRQGEAVPGPSGALQQSFAQTQRHPQLQPMGQQAGPPHLQQLGHHMSAPQQFQNLPQLMGHSQQHQMTGHPQPQQLGAQSQPQQVMGQSHQQQQQQVVGHSQQVIGQSQQQQMIGQHQQVIGQSQQQQMNGQHQQVIGQSQQQQMIGQQPQVPSAGVMQGFQGNLHSVGENHAGPQQLQPPRNGAQAQVALGQEVQAQLFQGNTPTQATPSMQQHHLQTGNDGVVHHHHPPQPPHFHGEEPQVQTSTQDTGQQIPSGTHPVHSAENPMGQMTSDTSAFRSDSGNSDPNTSQATVDGSASSRPLNPLKSITNAIRRAGEEDKSKSEAAPSNVHNAVAAAMAAAQQKDGGNAAMAKLHQGHLRLLSPGSSTEQGEETAVAKFRVTKLRSWRTGYARIISLHRTHFTTLDPDSFEVTNRWSYASVTQWLALPKEPDCILIEVVGGQSEEGEKGEKGAGGSNKLKFKTTDRLALLTTLLELKYSALVAQLLTSPSADRTLPPFPFFSQCARHTRHGTVVACSLLAAPHGVVERPQGGTQHQILQTYFYSHIHSVSLTSDDTNCVVLHMSDGRNRLFSILSSARRGGNGRSDFVTVLKEYFDILGLTLNLAESSSAKSWLDERRRLGQTADDALVVIGSFRVLKTSPRLQVLQGTTATSVRSLVLTKGGFLLEKDVDDGSNETMSGAKSADGVVSFRKLADIHALVRHRSSSVESGDTSLTIEFTNRTSRTYSSTQRDELIVAILDAAANLVGNDTIHLSDCNETRYRLIGISEIRAEVENQRAEMGRKAPSTTGIFQTDTIPLSCLKRVHQVSTSANAYLDLNSVSSADPTMGINPVNECVGVVEVCREFNANVAPHGEGLSDNKKVISGTLSALWGIVAKLAKWGSPPDSNDPRSSQAPDRHGVDVTLSPILQAIFRLCHTTTGFKTTVVLHNAMTAFTQIWTIRDTFASYWALMVLSALLVCPFDARDQEAEFVNKSVLLSVKGMVGGLLSRLLGNGPNAERECGDGVGTSGEVSGLTQSVISIILESVLCSNHDTTGPDQFSSLMTALSESHRGILSLLRSPSPLIIENTALILQFLSSHSPKTAALLRDEALSSALVLQHFHSAIFSPLEGQRYLSRYLCGLWMSGPPECEEKRLLQRMVPAGFLGYLKMPMLSHVEEDQLDELERQNVRLDDQGMTVMGASGGAGTNIKRLRKRIGIVNAALAVSNDGKQQIQHQQPENFRIFFHVMTKDHSLPDLIWNQQTRQELRIALESELQSVQSEQDARGGLTKIAWNHQQYTVPYPSLVHEVQVGKVYMRLWLQAGDAFIKAWEEPVRLFELLFRRLLCDLDRDVEVTIMCVRCLERLYAVHWAEIGSFSDVMILVRTMGLTKSTETQHRLLSLLSTLLGVSDSDDLSAEINVPANAEQLLNVESLGQLCQFVAWGHTNGVQVSNILKSVVGGGPSVLMITEGDNSRPDGSPHGSARTTSKTEAPKSQGDDAAPAVWYTAPAGRVPPSSGSIRGPFRVSQLISMMQSGELHNHSLVTAVHVEDYSSDSGSSNAVSEGMIDTGKWRMLENVWQLRWQLCTDGSDTGVFGPSEVSLIALRSLSRLVALHKSVDSQGTPYFPIPIAKRLLCGLALDPSASDNRREEVGSVIDTKESLPIICQALLSNDPRVVDSAANLLCSLMVHNEYARTKLYLTGLFFFACGYMGNNFKPLAKLLHSTHMLQHFRSGHAAATKETDIAAKDRSILGNMLPEGLLLVLVNHGPEKFADVFVNNTDTPEVIWSFDMRRHLVDMVLQHLGDFAQRLWQNTTAQYEYCPIPGIAYQRLDKEIFCHNYYLRNLCDEVRFPNWPISQPVEVFRACLEVWKQEVTRDEASDEDAQGDALKLLGLKSGDGGAELRKAYRQSARKYHPDKNPTGREMFERIQKAYEILLPIIESGGSIQSGGGSDETLETQQERDSFTEGLNYSRAQAEVISLLMRTQVLICKRHPGEVGQYKYPAYSLLLDCLSLPLSSSSGDASSAVAECMLKKKRAEFVRAAAELIFQTCLISPLNAAELVAEGGVDRLEAILDIYVSVAKPVETAKEEGTATRVTLLEIVTHVVRTLAGVAYFETGRAALVALTQGERFARNWRRCVDHFLTGNDAKRSEANMVIKRYALEGVANMSRSAELQALLIGSGVVWPTTRCLLGFDPTLDETSGDPDAEIDANMSQTASNTIARLSCRALGMLCGVMKEALATPPNAEVTASMGRLLTPPIARMLRNHRSTELLRTLNQNIETPSRVWNVRMRNELGSFLDKIEQNRETLGHLSVTQELAPVNKFEYSNLSDEVVIGGIYVRVFNNIGGGKEAIREVPDCSHFAKQLVRFVAHSIANDPTCSRSDLRGIGEKEGADSAGANEMKETDPVAVTDARFAMAVKSLLQLVQVDGLIDEVLFDEFSPSALLALLDLPQDSSAFDLGCEILLLLSPKLGFANALAEQCILGRLLLVLERMQSFETESSDLDATGSAASSQVLAKRQEKGWAILEALSSSASVAEAILRSSGWLELLGIIVGYSTFTKVLTARLGASKILSRVLWGPTTSSQAAALLNRFLPAALVAVLKDEGAEVMIRLFDKTSETPELIWDSEMREELRGGVASLLDDEIETSAERMDKNFTLPPEFSVKYKRLADELYIGGVYIRLFLKDPTFKLKNPTIVLEMMLTRWRKDLENFSKPGEQSLIQSSSNGDGALVSARQDTLELVTSASVCLCKLTSSLCDRLAHWGCISQAIDFMQKLVVLELIGTPLISVVRILHVAASRRANVEALAVEGDAEGRRGFVESVMDAIGRNPLHVDTAFMVELLKLVFENALGETHSKSNGAATEKSSVSLSTIDATQTANDGKALATAPRVGLEPVTFAPSPAPGMESVSGSQDDHPLSMFGNTGQQGPAAQQPSVPPGQGHHHGLQTHMYLPQNQTVATQNPLGQANSAHAAGYLVQGQNNSLSSGSTLQQMSATGYGNQAQFGGGRATAATSNYNPLQQPVYSGHGTPVNQTSMQQATPHRPFQFLSQRQVQQGNTQVQQQNYIQQQLGSGPQQIVQQSSTGAPYFQQSQQRNLQQPQSQGQQNRQQPLQQSFQQPPIQQQQQPYLQQDAIQQTQRHLQPPPQQQFVQQPQMYQQHQYSQPPTPQPQTNTSLPTSQEQFPAMVPRAGMLPTGQPMQSNSNQATDRGHIQNQLLSSHAYRPDAQHGLAQTTFPNGPNYQQTQAFGQPDGVASPYAVASGNTSQGAAFSGGADLHANAGTSVPQTQLPQPTPQEQPERPTEVAGSGVDARSEVAPSVVAEQKTTATAGAPNSAQGRVALLKSALNCRLVEFLLDGVLENETLARVKDPGAVKVHAVELLKLLMSDPGYGMKFALILDSLPAWAKYKSQDHSLFITGAEQKTDYFLTDGGGADRKLLTDGS